MRATRLVLIVAVIIAATLPSSAYYLPSITAISPNAVSAGSASFTLTVSGSYFNGKDRITWNGVRLTTTIVSLTQAQAVVPASYVASAGNANVAMWDSRTGTFSSAVTFTITSSSPISVNVTPPSTTLPAGGSQQFSAVVNGTSNEAVTWSATGGTISSTGVYTAPIAASTGQVLRDAVGPSPAGASVKHGATVSWQHTASGSNRLVTVACAVGKLGIGAFTLSTTYGGIGMLTDPVKLTKINRTGDGAVQMFYLVAPPTGQQTVSVTLSGTTADLECGSISFVGVNQLAPLRSTATSTGYSNTPSNTVASAAGDMVVNAIDYGCAGGSSKQTLAWMKQLSCSTGGSNGAQSLAAGAASVTTGYQVAYDQWGMVAASIAAAPITTTALASTINSSSNSNTYAITATSVADPTKSASATVTIGSSASTVSVSVSPATAVLTTNGTQQFTATVSGTTNTAVTWSASGGTVSSTGLYTAPSAAGTYIITATSAADPTTSASASVTVNAPVTVGISVAPTSATINTGGTQQFTASVTGSTNTAVTWSATSGSVSSTGLYTAPSTAGTYTVKATSAADTTKSASASVTVNAPVTVGISVAPTSATINVGGTQQFTASVTGSTNTAVTWSATSGSVSSTGLYTAPSTAGTYTVTATSAADTTKSASASVTVNAPVTVGISVAPTSATINTGGTQQFTASVTGSTNTAVTWSASGGTVSSTGLYTAPSAAGTYTVTATSAVDPTKSASATVTATAPVAYCTTNTTQIGPYTVCGTASNGGNGSSISTAYSPFQGNGVFLLLSYCAGGGTTGCDTIPTQSVTSITDQTGTKLACFVPSPSSPFGLMSGPGADAESYYLYYCPSIPANVSAIRANLDAAAVSLHLSVVEFKSGTIATSNFWDTDNSAVSATTGLSASVSTVTTNPNDLVLAFLHNGAPVYPSGGYPPVTPDPNYTAISLPNYASNVALEARSVSAAGSQPATADWSSTLLQWFGVIATLRAAGSPPPAVAVSISPTSSSLLYSGTQQFSATVSGSTNTAVTWSATGGTISASGLYSAPSTAGTYTVKATSVADPTKSASASVTVASVSVSVSPNNPTVTTSGTVQFAATVTGSTNTAVTWSVASGGGTVSTSGLYTAPSTAGTASVVATSVADTRSSALANVTINAPVTVLLSASPTSVSFGSVLVGQSGSQTVKLSNTGNSTVTISSANFTGSGFGLSGLTFPFTLAASASQNANLTFAPTGSGTASGSVSFVSNATNSPATVALSGSGTAPVQHTAMLNWQASGSNAVGFNVYRSTISGSSYTRLNSTTNSNPSYADSTVQSGQTYYYVVTQLDSTGMESGYSSPVTAVIPTP